MALESITKHCDCKTVVGCLISCVVSQENKPIESWKKEINLVHTKRKYMY